MKTVFAITGILMATLFMSQPAQARDTAPDFNLRSLAGKRLNLQNLLKEGPVLLDFWATWCKPCVKAMPKLQEIHETYGDLGLTIIGVNEDGPRGQSKVKPFLRARKLTFQVGLDPDGGLMKRMRVTALPTTLLIDRDGEIVYRQAGFTKGSEVGLIEAIETIVGPAPSKTEGESLE
jgi:cytochrome c biogenesis protein CcmG/thiol:disulfide interchange protein DsbE